MDLVQVDFVFYLEHLWQFDLMNYFAVWFEPLELVLLQNHMDLVIDFSSMILDLVIMDVVIGCMDLVLLFDLGLEEFEDRETLVDDLDLQETLLFDFGWLVTLVVACQET